MATTTSQSRMRQMYRRLVRSISGPPPIHASFSGLIERNEWIHNNQMLSSIPTPPKGANPIDDIIRILGDQYDSLEALLSVTVPTKDDAMRGKPIVKDDLTYNTTPELTLVSLFHAEGPKYYPYGRLLLQAIRSEKERRNQEDYMARSKGFCCSTAQYLNRKEGGFKKDHDDMSESGKRDSGFSNGSGSERERKRKVHECGCEKAMPEAWELGRSVM